MLSLAQISKEIWPLVVALALVVRKESVDNESLARRCPVMSKMSCTEPKHIACS